MNRHQFWIRPAFSVFAAILLAGCATQVASPTSTQRAPDMSRPLATASNAPVISPYSGAEVDAVEDAAMANQKVVRVGLLLPLSGRNAEMGKALRDAASVSLFDKYARLPLSQQTVRVELLPKDTGDTPEQAARAMNEALAEGVQFVIGPLSADATASAAPRAQARNISVLSFSNTRTQASPGAYMFGFSPAEQAERIVDFAFAGGKQKIAVLAPSSPLGDVVLTAARAAAEKQGMRIVAEARYQPSGGGMEAALNSLVQAGSAPKFEAILIPEGSTVLDTIMRGLSARGVKPSNVKFLGTGLWDDADLLRRVNLDSAWFASSPPELTRQFEGRFETTYNYDPPRIASLAYDAVALAVTLATSGRPFDTTALTNPAGFSGPANGIFRLRASGITQRGLAVMEVRNGSLQVISPAPRGF